MSMKLGAYTRLVQVASDIDFTVEDHVFEDETNGDCSHRSRRIRVSTRLQPAHRVKTLCHELLTAPVAGLSITSSHKPANRTSVKHPLIRNDLGECLK